MKTKKKVLFLDIDGVLTSVDSGTSFEDCHDPDNYGINERNWNKLIQLLDNFPELNIVIHSGWSKLKNDPDPKYICKADGKVYKSLLPEVIKRLGERCLGVVDHISWKDGGSKALEIKNWVKNNIPSDELHNYTFAVADDQCNGFNKLDRLVFEGFFIKIVNKEIGLSDTDVELLASFYKISDDFAV